MAMHEGMNGDITMAILAVILTYAMVACDGPREGEGRFGTPSENKAPATPAESQR